MPKTKKEGDTVAGRTRSQTPKPPTSARKTTEWEGSKSRRSARVSAAKQQLQAARDAREFTAAPSLSVDGTGICRIVTGKMQGRSQQEVYNYAFLVNRYIEGQRGRKVKVKSTKDRKDKQAVFCGAVRAVNKDLFDELNDGLVSGKKLFSVVAHVPDECITVHSFGQEAPSGPSGIGKAPGWMPMTQQANGLVAKIGNQTPNSTGQPDGPHVTLILVDGLVPDCLLPIQAVTAALGRDPYAMEEDGDGGESGDEASGDEASGDEMSGDEMS